MANTSGSTFVSSDLGKWVHNFYDRAFFLPNIEVSETVMNENLVQDFIGKINHDQIPRENFIKLMTEFRAGHVANVHSIKEILNWDAPDNSGGGCVAHLLHFTDTNKETGVPVETHSVLLANVKVINGKRTIFSLTEVMKQ